MYSVVYVPTEDKITLKGKLIYRHTPNVLDGTQFEWAILGTLMIDQLKL